MGVLVGVDDAVAVTVGVLLGSRSSLLGIQAVTNITRLTNPIRFIYSLPDKVTLLIHKNSI